MTRLRFGGHDRRMRDARRATGRARGIAVLAAVGFALSVAVVPTSHQVIAEEPLTDPAPTTVPESPPSGPTVPAEPTTETTLPAEPTTETTLPAEPVDEPAAGAQDTTTTVADTTNVSTTTEPSTPDPRAVPAARFAPFAAALGGLTLTITDGPFAVSPTTLDFGTYGVGSTATETVTLVNATVRDVVFQTFTQDSVSVTGVTCPSLGPFSAPNEYVLGVDQTCDLSVTVDTSSEGSVTGVVDLADTNIFGVARVTVTAEVIASGSPANDDWANAEDLSSLAIPAFADDPNTTGLQPAATVNTLGTTELATLEANESPISSGGSVWYSYASPTGGFAGRLGYRVTPGFVVEAFGGLTSAETGPDSSAPGDDWTVGSPFVRMEPGHRVWFRVSRTSLPSGPFILDLFQAPNLQDDIANAEEVRPDFVGDADTFHVTEDFEGGPNAWYTSEFTRPGRLSLTAYSLRAGRNGSTSVGSARPFNTLLYRAPTTDRVGVPNGLEWVANPAVDVIDLSAIAGLSGSGWSTSIEVDVEPGRYYWSFDEEFQGPTWLRFDATFTAKTIEPVISISGPPNAAVGGTASVTVTARNPDSTQPVEAGFRFGLEGEFVERVLAPLSFSSGISCGPVPGDDPPRGFSCVSSDPLAPGASVSATFTVSTPGNDALTPCQPLNSAGKRTGPTDYQGPVCLNVVAYPGPVDPTENPINRAIPGRDAAMVSIPLVGSYVRFTASATDAQPGGTVALTVTPRNAGTGSRTGIAFQLDPSPVATWIPGALPAGWSCQLTFAPTGTVGCTAPNLTLGAGQASAPLTLTFTAPPVPNPTSCPVTVFPLPTPPPNPCGTFQLGWVGVGVGVGGVPVRRSGTATQMIAYGIGDPPPETSIDSVTVTGRDVSVTVSATDDGVGPLTFECAVAPGYGAGSEVWQPCVSPAAFTNLAEGVYVVSARARDAAGNVDATPAIRAFTVDVTPPQLVVSSPVDGATYLPGQVPQLSWVCTDLDLDASPLVVTVNGSPIVGVDLPQAPGVYTVAVRCVNGVGLATTVTTTYTVRAPDTTPPVITITGIAPGGVVTTATPTVTITSDEPLANVICTVDTPTPGGGTASNDVGCFTPGDTSDTFTLPDLPDGSVTLTVSGQDEAGNDTTVTLTFSVEVLPTASISSPADGATYRSSEVPTSVSYVCSDNGIITSEEVQLVPQGGGLPTLLAGPPPNTPGTHTVRVVCVDGLGEEATATATYTVTAPPTGPCVIVDTQSVDFGEVAVGSTSPTRPVVVRSCSDSPVRLAVSVSNATGSGGSQTWLAGTSTVPPANQFTWSVTPPGGPSPIPVGPTQASVGPVLAPFASRTDDHRIALGSIGPGLGTRFTSTFTYTAFTP